MKLKNNKLLLLSALLIITVSALAYYISLPNRHKAIIKTKVAHGLNLINSSWDTQIKPSKIQLTSPSFIIDDIYKSMEGPKSSTHLSLSPNKSELFWMKGFTVKAYSSKNNQAISNDFICHFNIDYNDQDHHGRWNLLNRLGSQYPRLTSLSHGVEQIEFPEGFGYPFFSDESFFITTQSLNHNVTDSIFSIYHQISINYKKHQPKLKPLFPKTIYMMLPFDPDTPYEKGTTMQANMCIPVETKNHTYYNNEGQVLSGHWKIFPEKKLYRYNATQQLKITDTLSIHQITPHLHPFAEKLVLFDVTAQETLYECIVKNHSNRIGLEQTPAYSSAKGFKMYPTHEYEIHLTTHNTTQEEQDMMASLFLFTYDAELHKKTQQIHETK